MSKNMALWNDVKVPVKGSLKKVTSRGGFTAINAQHQVEYATEMFGPMGSNWGLKDLEWDIVYSGATPVQLTLDAVFFYPEYTNANSEVSPSGEFEIGSDIEWSAKGECRKKLRTDLLTKSLSQIGFSSDVFKNMWDGDRYIGKDPEGANQPGPSPTGPDKDEATKKIENAKSMAQVKKIATSCKQRAIDEEWINHLSGLVKLRQDEFDANKGA